MHLREAIRHMLSPHPAPAESRAYIDLTLRIATIHILKRVTSGALTPSFFGLTPNDLALDCLGPLFARDADGRFTQITTYYTAIHWESLSDAELLAATRRIVYSTVHQQLVRLYRDHDPSLEKIIRNLRNALRGSTVLREERRGAELWIAVTGETPEQRVLPEMPWAYLEGELSGHLHDRTRLRDVVGQCAMILDGQTVYRKSVPLTSLALLLRMAYARVGTEPEEDGEPEETALRSEEAERIIAGALATLDAEKRPAYVAKGKVTDQQYTAYMGAIRGILCAEFVENDGNGVSYHVHLERVLPGLSQEEYREHHRCHLEYLAKLARERFLAMVRQELLGTQP